MREPVRFGQQGETGLCYMRISAISPRNGLTGKQAIEATALATTELAKAMALVMVHGEERGARRYYETGAAVRFGYDDEPYVLVLPDLPGTWRAVMTAEMRSGRGSMIGPDTSRRARWWELGLECGHRVERTARYRPLPPDERQRGGTQHRDRDDLLPPPKRADCEQCKERTRREETPA